MKNKLAGRLTLQEAIAATLADAKAKIAASRGESKEEKKEDKLLAFEKKEHGHLPSVKEEKAECSKEASAAVIDSADPEEVEKLASALDEASELLVKEADSIENGGEKKQGGEQLPTQSPTGGKQPYKKDKARHQVPTHTGMMTPKDAPGAATAVPTDDNRAPGGTGAKYPAEGPLRKKGSVQALEEVVQAAIKSQGTGEPIVEEAEVPEVEKQAWSMSTEGHELDAAKARAREKAEHEKAKAEIKYDSKVHGAKKYLRGARDLEHLRKRDHEAYVARKHEAGKNAYNPFGGFFRSSELAKTDPTHWDKEGKKGKAKAASAEPQETAVDYILGKIAKVENGGESKQGGEQLSNHAPVPSNPGRQMIANNGAPAKATKREAKAEPKRALKEVLTEPALTASTDSKVQENLRNASKGGVKIAAAKALFAKIAAEGCQCGGDASCRYCKMKKAAAEIKAKAPTEKSEDVPSEQ